MRGLIGGGLLGLLFGGGLFRGGFGGIIGGIFQLMLIFWVVRFFARMVMGGDLLRGQVRVVPVAAPAMPRPAGVITNPRLGESPAARALVGVIRATIAELAASGDVDITR